MTMNYTVSVQAPEFFSSRRRFDEDCPVTVANARGEINDFTHHQAPRPKYK